MKHLKIELTGKDMGKYLLILFLIRQKTIREIFLLECLAKKTFLVHFFNSPFVNL